MRIAILLVLLAGCHDFEYQIDHGPMVFSEVDLNHDVLRGTWHWASLVVTQTVGFVPRVDVIRVLRDRIDCGEHGKARGCRWEGGLIEVSCQADFPHEVLAHEMLHSATSEGHPGPVWDLLRQRMASIPWVGPRLCEEVRREPDEEIH
jgi:hypothetical protein